MKKALGVLVVVLLVIGVATVVLNKPSQEPTSFVAAKTVDAKPVCEAGNVKNLKTVSIAGSLQGSEYLLCENGVWTGLQKSTKTVGQVAAEHKVVQ